MNMNESLSAGNYGGDEYNINSQVPPQSPQPPGRAGPYNIENDSGRATVHTNTSATESINAYEMFASVKSAARRAHQLASSTLNQSSID